MSLPYFPMYPSDFEAKTSHLTIAEDGAYNRLLRICWMTPGCTMPADEVWIMRRARVRDDAERDAIRAVLAEFFTVTDGRYSNAKLMRVWIASNEAHEKRKNAGARGGKAKALSGNKKTPSNAIAMLKQPEPEPEPDKKERDANASLVHSFDAFWKIWPNKTAKQDAVKAWKKLTLEDRRDAYSKCRTWFSEWQAGHPDASPIHPATFLNQKRWQDEPAPKLQSLNGGSPHGQSASKGQRRVDAFIAGAKRAR